MFTHKLWLSSYPGEIGWMLWTYLFSLITICVICGTIGILDLLFRRFYPD